jgi:hypothetical protein
LIPAVQECERALPVLGVTAVLSEFLIKLTQKTKFLELERELFGTNLVLSGGGDDVRFFLTQL